MRSVHTARTAAPTRRGAHRLPPLPHGSLPAGLGTLNRGRFVATTVTMNLHPDLETELRRTLLAEFGARAIYGQLAALTRDEELEQVLRRLRAEEVEQVRELRAVFAALGLRARRRSFRRWCLAGLLATFAAVFGVRFALRICCDAERTASRWYATYRTWLTEAGELELAETCGRLGLNKHRHAEILSTWVEHAPRRT